MSHLKLDGYSGHKTKLNGCINGVPESSLSIDSGSVWPEDVSVWKGVVAKPNTIVATKHTSSN